MLARSRALAVGRWPLAVARRPGAGALAGSGSVGRLPDAPPPPQNAKLTKKNAKGAKTPRKVRAMGCLRASHPSCDRVQRTRRHGGTRSARRTTNEFTLSRLRVLRAPPRLRVPRTRQRKKERGACGALDQAPGPTPRDGLCRGRREAPRSIFFAPVPAPLPGRRPTLPPTANGQRQTANGKRVAPLRGLHVAPCLRVRSVAAMPASPKRANEIQESDAREKLGDSLLDADAFVHDAVDDARERQREVLLLRVLVERARAVHALRDLAPHLDLDLL